MVPRDKAPTELDSMNQLRVQAIRERDKALAEVKILAAELAERRHGHSAMRVKDGKIETFDPHPRVDAAALDTAAEVINAIVDVLRGLKDRLTLIERENKHLLALAEDAHRFRFLTEDHDDAVTRRRVRELLDSMKTSSYSAMTRDIDAARTEAFKRAVEADPLSLARGERK